MKLVMDTTMVIRTILAFFITIKQIISKCQGLRFPFRLTEDSSRAKYPQFITVTKRPLFHFNLSKGWKQPGSTISRVDFRLMEYSSSLRYPQFITTTTTTTTKNRYFTSTYQRVRDGDVRLYLALTFNYNDANSSLINGHDESHKSLLITKIIFVKSTNQIIIIFIHSEGFYSVLCFKSSYNLRLYCEL